MICRSMYLSYEESVSLNISKDSPLYADLLRYRYIQLCTILDEFEILNGLAKNDEYLKETLYVISPVTRALSQFTGIKRARNYMLAHFNRDKKKNFHPWWIALKNLKLPRTQKEINDIYKYLHIMNAFIVCRYYEDLKDITTRIKPDYDSYFKWLSEQDKNIDYNKSIFDSVTQEVYKKMADKGISDQVILDPIMTKVMDRINQSKNNIKENMNKNSR